MTNRSPRADARFAVASREELWIGGRRVENRLTHGEAVETDGGIVARDSAVPSLVEASGLEIEQLRAAVPPGFVRRVRYVAEVRLDGRSSAIVLSEGAWSLVSSRETAQADRELLRRAAAGEAVQVDFDYRGLPIVWTNGSGAVLLHEAAGHPAEHGHGALRWPSWLSARDGATDLLAGERPATLRRASFSDPPLARMNEVRVSQHDAPFPLPDRRVEVFLVEGGSYDPLTGTVSVSVAAADLVDGGQTTRLPRFVLRQRRERVAEALLGASGDPVRYPGVVCSREGQELLVASYAPLLVTVFA